MKSENKVYLVELFMILILLFALFAPSIIGREVLAFIMLGLAFIVFSLFKKKKIHSIYHKQVIILLSLFGVLYVTLFYLLGLYFGFINAKIILSPWSFMHYILPIATIIITSELIRNRLIDQNVKFNFVGRKINISLGLCYIAMVLVDLLIYTGVYDLTNLNDFLTAMGFVLFASMSCNLFYNYVSIRFGSYGIIAFRLITVLYAFIIPFLPDVFLYFKSILRIVCPYFMYIIFEKTYAKRSFEISVKDKTKNFIETSVVFAIVTVIALVVSCKFTYGVIVIGSRSMSGTIEQGDAVLYKNTDTDKIDKGDVVIFKSGGLQTVHRVVSIQEINGEIRYYTKGDANSKMDDGYRLRENITGVVKLRIKYLGVPTLFIRSLFN
jgi:signal peptidase I